MDLYWQASHEEGTSIWQFQQELLFRIGHGKEHMQTCELLDVIDAMTVRVTLGGHMMLGHHSHVVPSPLFFLFLVWLPFGWKRRAKSRCEASTQECWTWTPPLVVE